MRNLYSKIQFLVFVSLVLFSSCSKDDSITDKEKTNYTFRYSMTADEIKASLSLIQFSEMSDIVKYGIDVYSFEYPMQYNGNDITASGLISVPKSAGDVFPVLSFQHGTMLKKSEAPSVFYNSLQNRAMASMAGVGYVVSFPDYVGFGSSASYLHPYLHKKSNVDATLQMLNSIQQLETGELSGVSISNDLFLAGYSQGGWVTLATLDELENSSDYASVWNIKATFCGAGPYDPKIAMDYILSQENYAQPHYTPYVLLSFKETGYNIGDLSNYYKEPYASLIPDLYDGMKGGGEINQSLTTVVADLYTNDFLNNKEDSAYSELTRAFNENKVDAWVCESPLLLVHGESDVYVPVQTTTAIYSEFISLNASNVSIELLPQFDHNTATLPSVNMALEFFESNK